MKIPQRDNPIADMNLTPLIDVMMVLMIIFMVTSPLDPAGINLDLPDAEASVLPRDDNKITVYMNKKREIEVSFKDVSVKTDMDGLISVLKTKFKGRKEANIKADKDLKYQDVMTLLVTVKKAGVTKIGLITSGASSEKENGENGK